MMTFTGDVLFIQNESTGQWDIQYYNGQPRMTDGFETCVLLAVFGDPNTIQNAMTSEASEKYISLFPSIVNRARVSDTVKKNGTEAIKKALKFMISENMASEINVTGSIISATSIRWDIDIYAPDCSTQSKYTINWQKGALTFGCCQSCGN